jgi:hypothetical protein
MSTCISTDRITPAVVPDAQAIADCLAHTAKIRPQDANAVQVYRGGLQLDPCNIEALNELGRCMLAAKNDADAFECFATAADIGWDRARAERSRVTLRQAFFANLIIRRFGGHEMPARFPDELRISRS